MTDGKILTLRIACLSGIAEIEKECYRRQLKLSEELREYLLRQTLQKLGAATAQRLICKLVSAGKISWDEYENFEVEAILEHCLSDDGEWYYLIKWKGWTSRYNTWEPQYNLNCKDLITKFHEAHRETRKRKRVGVGLDDDDLKTGRQRVDDLYWRIVQNSNSLTPYKLLGLDGKLSEPELKRYRDRGLVCNVLEDTHQFRKIAHAVARKSTKSYKTLKAESQIALKVWEKKINQINTDPAPITVENTCDLEGPPAGFVYISDYIPGPGIQLPTEPVVGCECSDCSNCSSCCPANMGAERPYNKRKKLRVQIGTPLYECNKLCKCDQSCPNRVVQLGRKMKVCIFRTSNSRGWGVKTKHKIVKGTFVMEYVGEVITSEEAEARGKIYDSEGMTYLFDLDFNDGDNPYTVDARNYGNVSHFVNHSCDPNLAVYGVWINNLDPSLPRIALFARRDIEAGEELTFDYLMKIDQHVHATTPFTTPVKETNSVGTVVENSNEDAPDELAGTPVNKQIEIDYNDLIRDTSEPTSVIEIDYSDLTNNNLSSAAKLPTTPVKQVPSNGIISPRGIRSPLKNQVMGLRSPLGAKKQIKCHCGTKSCRGYLF